ncbi:hypothetical protein GCM10007276_11150 [Agaricicola taiwanensis]|uniref:Uncharacterized protein n=1 Tax=Agaricicola taiwanensis TaxID=591372 RepID=A0A8J2YFX7_9RHOB|nr:hypothetical protein GCM10007276_11150 [Agaricicola taiwanensis]
MMVLAIATMDPGTGIGGTAHRRVITTAGGTARGIASVFGCASSMATAGGCARNAAAIAAGNG